MTGLCYCKTMLKPSRDQDRFHPLDRRAARIVALGVCAAMFVLLGFIHRDDLIPGPKANTAQSNGAYAACLAERHGSVDQMVADGVIGPDKEALFKSRAEALCRDLNPG